MIEFHIHCTEKMKADIKSGKLKAPGKVSGSSMRVCVEEGDVELLESVIDMIHLYGVSSQEDHDHDLSEKEELLLRAY